MFYLLRHQALKHLGKIPTLQLEVRNCQVNFQKHLHVSSTLSEGSVLKDLIAKPVYKPKPHSKFPGFDPIFVSPHIRTIQFACRLKLYNTGIILACLPLSFYLLQKELILPSQVGVSAGFAVGTLVVLGLVGEYFRKFVGILYLNEDRTEVIISHNSFFGRRKDVTVEVDNIMPLADTPETVDDLVWKIRLYSGDPKSYYICTRLGGILSRKGFKDIFGEENFVKN